jgi:hypothetical protein
MIVIAVLLCCFVQFFSLRKYKPAVNLFTTFSKHGRLLLSLQDLEVIQKCLYNLPRLLISMEGGFGALKVIGGISAENKNIHCD